MVGDSDRSVAKGGAVAAIVVAGGSGERFGRAGGKQLAPACGKPVLAWTLMALDAAGCFDLFVVVCPGSRFEEYEAGAIVQAGLSTPHMLAPAGETRQESVGSGLAAVPDGYDWVAIHDGARPLVSSETVRRAVTAAMEGGIDGVVVGHASVDTLKVVSEGRVLQTLDRERVWSAQTPQVFALSRLRTAFDHARRSGFIGTDDASVLEHDGGSVGAVEGERSNLKVTTPEDIEYLEAVLTLRQRRHD